MRPLVYALSGSAAGSALVEVWMVAFDQKIMASAMMFSTVILLGMAVLAYAVDRRVRRSLVMVADELLQQAANEAQGDLYHRITMVKTELKEGGRLTKCAHELGKLSHALKGDVE